MEISTEEMINKLLEYCDAQSDDCKTCMFSDEKYCVASMEQLPDTSVDELYDIYSKNNKLNNKQQNNKKIVLYDIEFNQENLLYIMCDKGHFVLNFSTIDDLAKEIVMKTCVCDDVIEENYISFSDGHSTKRIHKELTQIVDIYILDMNKFNELYIKLIDIGLKINMLEKINQEEYLKINFENIINIKQKEENK